MCRVFGVTNNLNTYWRSLGEKTFKVCSYPKHQNTDHSHALKIQLVKWWDFFGERWGCVFIRLLYPYRRTHARLGVKGT